MKEGLDSGQEGFESGGRGSTVGRRVWKVGRRGSTVSRRGLTVGRSGFHAVYGASAAYGVTTVLLLLLFFPFFQHVQLKQEKIFLVFPQCAEILSPFSQTLMKFFSPFSLTMV